MTARDYARTFIAQPLKRGHAWSELSYGYDFMQEGIMYLMWQDLDPKKPDERKVAEARARFVERFGYAATEVIEKAPGLWWLGPIVG